MCEPCSPGCVTCDDVTPCADVIMTRVVLLGVQVFTMAVSVAFGVAVVRLRKTKVMYDVSNSDAMDKWLACSTSDR